MAEEIKAFVEGTTLTTRASQKKMRLQYVLSSVVILLILFADQLTKCYVKTHFLLHESVEVTSWFNILFIENKGMAFGMDFVGTMFLTIFRLVAVIFFCSLLRRVVQRGVPTGLIVCMAMIIAGAAGNIIDNCFYGLIFSDSSSILPAEIVPFGSGYGNFLEGKVVDMLYFPLFTWPDWLPIIGGNVFFSAIFNLADAAITCGGIAILLFYSKSLFDIIDKKNSSSDKV